MGTGRDGGEGPAEGLSPSLAARISLALAAGDMALWEWDPQTGNGFASRHLNELLGLDPDVKLDNLSKLVLHVHPDDVQHLLDSMHAYVASGSTERHSIEFRFVRADGGVRWVRSIGRAVAPSPGAKVRYVGTSIDITAERELAEQLEQARKLEAIGRLAGGIAHDFNNLLTAIFASLEFAARADGKSIDRELDTIRVAAERASALTRQLLAFARKQVVSLRTLELNPIISKLEPMLRRLLREDVALDCRLAPDLWGCQADASLIEQVLVNLLTNAREAMPDGGTATIETRNLELAARTDGYAEVPPGAYVELVVRDQGEGMDKQALQHLFEPFFTTKPTGTGLGLASSYGIVKQLAGHITVSSERGKGTAFHVLLPRTAARALATATPQAVRAQRHPSQAQTVLFVEDDELLRGAVTRGLGDLGFQVLAAHGGSDALALVEAHPGAIDIAVIDVIMPMMSGRALADRLLAVRPDLKILFASGYTRDVIARHNVLEPGTSLLAKPYTLEDLVAHIENLVGQAPA